MADLSSVTIQERQSTARLSRTFSKGMTAVDVAEPLASLDHIQPASVAGELMQTKQLAVLGVRREGLVVAWARAEDLKEGSLGDHARDFREQDVCDDTAPIDAVLRMLSENEQIFVRWLGEVTAVITRRDLQKAPLRMWIFGAITVLDTNLTWAISELFPEDAWQGRITAGRLEKAKALRAERERRGSACELLDCLQIKDKADIILSEPAHFIALGLASRREADRLTRDIEKLRNHLAHAQKLEAEHLATATRLASLIHSIVQAEGVHRIVALHQRDGTQV